MILLPLSVIFDTMIFAAGLVTSRSIEMSSSVASATNTTYAVSFSIATTGNVEAIILDFCDNDPLVADTTCTAPGGFSLTASPAVSGQSGAGSCNLSTFTTASTLNSNRTLELSAGAAVSMTSGGACTFNITTVTNPNSANHSFYARVYTYTLTTNANSYSPGVLTNVTDDGGFALSTASQITISATVQETMTFCVSLAAPGNGCTGLTTPAIVIGHGSPPVITSSQVDATPAYAQVTTNASAGFSVRMKASNTCANGGLSTSGGASCLIPGIGSTAIVFPATTADFGLCVADASDTIAASYTSSSPSCNTAWASGMQFGMNGGNVTGTYGDVIYSKNAPITNDNAQLLFAAQAAAATPAGIYSGKEALIATGIF